MTTQETPTTAIKDNHGNCIFWGTEEPQEYIAENMNTIIVEKIVKHNRV